MPVARFKMPDGRVARFEVPEGTSPEAAQAQIEQMLAQSAQQTASQPEAAQPSDSFLKDARDVAGEFAAGANRAVIGFADTVADAADTVAGGYAGIGTLVTGGGINDAVNALNTRRVPRPSDVINNTTGQNVGQGGYMEPGVARDAVAAAGEVLPASVAIGQGFRSLASRLPVATAGESTGAGVLREMGRTTATQDAIAGGLSGAGGAVGESIDGERGRLVGSVLAPLAAAPILGAQSVVSRARRGTIPAAQAELIDQGRAAGVPMMTSDVIPPKTFPGRALQQTAEKIPVAGTAPVRQAQQQMRQKAVADVADKYGEYSYDAIISSLKTQKNRIKSAAGAVLQRTGTTLDSVGNVPTPNTATAIAAARQELQKPGVIQSSGAVDDLDQLITALGTPQSFTTLKENRTAFREIVASTDKADRSQLTTRAKALLESVYKGMTDDMESFAQQNLNAGQFSRWQKANEVYAGQARLLTRTKLKNVLDKGDVTPESVKQMLFSQNASEQKLLYGSLTGDGRKNARSAIISKVVEDLSKRASGLSPNSFASELKKYGSQIDVFFKGPEKQQLKGLGLVLDATRRAQDAAVTTPTGQQLIGGLAVTGIALDPVATLGTAGTLGALARIYESAPVRSALLRLGSVPPDSGGYAQALLNAQLAISAAGQQGQEKSAGTKQPRQ